MTKKPKLILSKPQQEVIETLAYIVVCQGIEKNVPGMEGFFKHYIEKSQTDRQRAIYQALKASIRSIRKETLKQLAADKDFPDPSPKEPHHD